MDSQYCKSSNLFDSKASHCPQQYSKPPSINVYNDNILELGLTREVYIHHKCSFKIVLICVTFPSHSFKINLNWNNFKSSWGPFGSLLQCPTPSWETLVYTGQQGNVLEGSWPGAWAVPLFLLCWWTYNPSDRGGSPATSRVASWDNLKWQDTTI